MAIASIGDTPDLGLMYEFVKKNIKNYTAKSAESPLNMRRNNFSQGETTDSTIMSRDMQITISIKSKSKISMRPLKTIQQS